MNLCGFQQHFLEFWFLYFSLILMLLQFSHLLQLFSHCLFFPPSIRIMFSKCCGWCISLIICFVTWNMSLCWNYRRRWLASIYIISSISWAHSMSKLFPWRMHRLWKQMEVMTIFGIFHNGISNLFNRIFHRPFKFSKAFFIVIEVLDFMKFNMLLFFTILLSHLWMGNQFQWQKCALHYFLGNVEFLKQCPIIVVTSPSKINLKT